MKITTKAVKDTVTLITVTANENELAEYKSHVINKLSKDLKVSGFRSGKVPPAVAEKQLDSNYLQSQVIEHAINHLYFDALTEKNLKPVGDPKIEIKKFVPYSELEFSAEIETIGEVKLPDYKTINIKSQTVKVTKEDVAEVLKRLQNQQAEYKDVEREAKTGDRVWIDFEGKDDKQQPVRGAKGKDYPLILGSNTFIEGFEKEISGLKKGDDKTFTLKFPKDYPLKALQSKNVTFKIKVNKVEETNLPEIDDTFASKLGAFKTVEDLKADIEKQLKKEKEHQAQHAFEEEIIKSLAAKTKVALPDKLVEEQMDAIDKEFRQNLAYRGETFEDYLESNVKTLEEYREKELKPLATERLTAGLMLSEIAKTENISVTEEELKIRLQVLKNQYKDPKMQAEIEDPKNHQQITNQLLTEKTIAKLVSFTK